MTLVESLSASMVDGCICINRASQLSMTLPFCFVFWGFFLLVLVVTGSDLNVEGLEEPDFTVGKTIPSAVCCVSEGHPQEGLKSFTSLAVETLFLISWCKLIGAIS